MNSALILRILQIASLLTLQNCKQRHFDSPNVSRTKSLTAAEIHAWPSKTIPYEFDFDADNALKTRVREAVKMVNDAGVVRIIEQTGNNTGTEWKPTVIFSPANGGCRSLGYGYDPERGSLIKLASECEKGTIAHEILHALGLLHEQANPLGKPPKIFFDRIQTGFEDQFDYQSSGDFKTMKPLTTYDADSIMHYDSWGTSICYDPSDPAWSDAKRKLPDKRCAVKNWRELTPAKGSLIDCVSECVVMLDSETGKPIERNRDYLSKGDIAGLKILYGSKN
jgi:hypothetical protein